MKKRKNRGKRNNTGRAVPFSRLFLVTILLLSLVIHGVIFTINPILVTFGSDIVTVSSLDTGAQFTGFQKMIKGLPGIVVRDEGTLILASVNEYTYKISQRKKLETYVNEYDVAIAVNPTPVMAGDVYVFPPDDSADRTHPPERELVVVEFHIRLDNPFHRKHAVLIC